MGKYRQPAYKWEIQQKLPIFLTFIIRWSLLMTIVGKKYCFSGEWEARGKMPVHYCHVLLLVGVGGGDERQREAMSLTTGVEGGTESMVPFILLGGGG